MALPESKYKRLLFDKVSKSLKEIGNIDSFLKPIDDLMARKDIDENKQMLLIEKYVKQNFSKFAGIEEVRKLLKIEPKDYSKGL